MSSTKRRRTKYAGGPWLGYVIHGLRCNDWHGLPVTRQTHRERLDIGRSLATQDAISTAIERALWSSIQALGMLREILIVSDDTAQFAVDRHVLCEMHTERVVHRLVTFTNPRRVPQNHVLALIWRLYDHLKEYHADPLARRLSRFGPHLPSVHSFRRARAPAHAAAH